MGECCRAGWDVEVEPHIVEAVRSGKLRPVLATDAPFVPLPDVNVLAPSRTATGDCTFHHANRCSLQLAGGEAMLPSACRHFPRVYLRDARGTFLTLSHFCPTAASLLLDTSPVTIVDAQPPLALAEPIEGLDAREALPPLVRPGLLADTAGYGAWEEAVVRTFLDAPDVDTAFERIEAATAAVRRWSPAKGPLKAAVERAFAATTETAVSAPRCSTLSRAFELIDELTGGHPLMEVPSGFERGWARVQQAAGEALHGPMARYMAASTFGNWIAYRGHGLRSIVEWLRACYDVVRVQMVRNLSQYTVLTPQDLLESFRSADYIMVHTVDSVAFGRAAADFEKRS